MFHGDVPIDVTKIHARKQNKKNGAGVAASSPTASDSQGASISGSANSRTNAEGLNFAEVWKEAHTQFTKNIRDGKYARTPVIIDNQDSKSE